MLKLQKNALVEVCFEMLEQLVFSNIHENVKAKQQALISIQEEIDESPIKIRYFVLHKQKQVRDYLEYALDYQHSFLKEKKKKFLGFLMVIETLPFSIFFVKKRNNSNGIHELVEEDQVLEDPKAIEDHILSFYKTLYSHTTHCSYDEHKRLIAKYIPSLV